MTQQMKAMPKGLIALALGGFGIGLTEFGIVGLLPEITADFDVSESVAGYLVSGYALSVAVGAIGLTAAVSRVERKRVLLGLVVLFIVGNLISAMAPTYAVMLTGRIVAALCHGAFFSVGAVVASNMVPENRKAGAISLMFAGLTVANVVGIPFGTFIGQQLGWRATFWVITAIGVITFFGIQLLVQRSPAPEAGSLRSEIGVLRRPQVLLSAMVSILTFGGLVGAYTYIAFTLTEISGFEAKAVPGLLLLFGVGTFIGNLLGGRLADRALDRSLQMILVVLIAVLSGFALMVTNALAALVAMFLLGAIGFATAPGLQLRIMHFAGDAPTVASGANIAALNIGNAFGTWLGGLAIAAGLGFVSPLWVGAGLATAALLVLMPSSAASRRVA
ncbi:DHA1 family inner membrane transport protein [Chromohalobacter marismortui]|uniref:DHA1 family inner membrane transport protein n=1 Tax=Chromohalobacter marismortui TaxID=42055 RepID=A0A4R7NS80_9GAMM|nr:MULTISPECIES: MFS transporter [Chromohalobacter]MCI0509223.1 MFS transporter [Chromohalobacter sp.]MCI0592082.1 MFS transporter [Chromohalobacter sp.]TDU23885.1 DHA1 family inner membrane transport protein [Chromohalobacter marismortui]